MLNLSYGNSPFGLEEASKKSVLVLARAKVGNHGIWNSLVSKSSPHVRRYGFEQAARLENSPELCRTYRILASPKKLRLLGLPFADRQSGHGLERERGPQWLHDHPSGKISAFVSAFAATQPLLITLTLSMLFTTRNVALLQRYNLPKM